MLIVDCAQVVTTSGWSVSVNTWVEAPGDQVARVKEALVRWQVGSLVNTLQGNIRCSLQQHFGFLSFCLQGPDSESQRG